MTNLLNRTKTIVSVYNYDSRNGMFAYSTMRAVEVIRTGSEDDEDFDDGRKEFKKLNASSKYVPTKGDKIYFEPGCSVPRFKVKELCNKYGIRVVKSYSPGCISIIGDDTLYKLVTNHTGTVHSKDVILDCLVKFFPSEQDLIKAIYDSESQHVLFNYRSRNQIENISNADLDDYWQLRPAILFDNDDYYNRYVNIVSSNKCYHESSIQSLLNSGAVMNEEEYETVSKMLESTSNDDKKMALEIMANCDYEKSCVNLLRLFMNYGGIIHDVPTRKHVNFKALLSFFEITVIGRVNLNDVMASLIKRKLLNKSNLDRLMPLVIEDIKNSHTLDNFQVKDIIYDDVVSKALDENVLDKDKDTDIYLDNDDEEINPKL